MIFLGINLEKIKQRSPIHQKQNNAIAPSLKLPKSDRLSKSPNSDRNFKFLDHFGNGTLKSLQIFFAKFSSISV
jgi:hypothetical protein